MMAYTCKNKANDQIIGNTGIATSPGHPSNKEVQEHLRTQYKGLKEIVVTSIHEFKSEDDYIRWISN